MAIVFRQATPQDLRQLCLVHEGAFGNAWSDTAYSYVMHMPGYDVNKEYVIVAPDGTFAAFTVTWHDTLNSVGLFEPVGVHKDFHRKGLGRALMYASMRRMQEQGIKTAIVWHGVDNPASTGLYAAVGFLPKYHVHEYKKALT